MHPHGRLGKVNLCRHKAQDLVCEEGHLYAIWLGGPTYCGQEAGRQVGPLQEGMHQGDAQGIAEFSMTLQPESQRRGFADTTAGLPCT